MALKTCPSPINCPIWSHCPWSTLVKGGKEQYQPPGKLTLELVLANQNKTFMFMDYAAYQVGREGSLPHSTKVIHG